MTLILILLLPERGRAVVFEEVDVALEDVGVVGVVGTRRLGRGNVQQAAEFREEELIVRPRRKPPSGQ